MTKIILTGACGKMGKVIQSVVSAREDCEIVAGVDKYNDGNCPFPVYEKIDDVTEKADVVIDFSNPSLLDSLLTYGESKNTALVIATTGFDECQKKKIKDSSAKCPVFFTYNMSIGINLLANLAKKAVQVLGDEFDIEIVEQHHNQKIDAPSGTALMLADAITEEIEKPMKYEYDRHSKREKRTKNEIGIHSIRGGTIVGEHEIIFAGRDENIILSHSARSKEVFAVGAVNAAVFMTGKSAGMYDMGELVK
ncbi:MAG: 4-hydroxy-tetrahydrodipicolinate reductase [Eubacterium sp.]